MTKDAKSATAMEGEGTSGPTHLTSRTKFRSQVAAAVAEALTIREAPLPQSNKHSTVVAADGKSNGRHAKDPGVCCNRTVYNDGIALMTPSCAFLECVWLLVVFCQLPVA